MKILICDDDPTTRALLSGLVAKIGHEAVCRVSGDEGVTELCRPHGARLALLDWEMPNRTGIEVCREVRRQISLLETYIIMLTSRQTENDIVAGLDAGANDYVKKPFNQNELIGRIKIGVKVLELQEQLRVLSGILPICAWCKKIRDAAQQWVAVDRYVSQHTEVHFTHGICPDCSRVQVKEASDSFLSACIKNHK